MGPAIPMDDDVPLVPEDDSSEELTPEGRSAQPQAPKPPRPEKPAATEGGPETLPAAKPGGLTLEDAEEARPKRPKQATEPPPTLPRIQHEPPPGSEPPETTPASAPRKKRPEPARAVSRTREERTGSSSRSAERSRDRHEEPSRERKSAREPGSSREAGKAIVEETPELDTYDTRRRFRLAIGAGAVAALLLAIIFIFKPFGGGADGISAADRESAAADDSVLAAGFRGSGGTGAAGASGGKAAGTNEGMAQGLLADAKAFARKQENSIALQRLGSILDRFPDSKAGAEAREALQRHSLNQPLFPEPGQVVTPLEAVAVAPAVEPEVIPEPMPEAEVAANTIPPPPVAPEPRAEAGSSLPTAAVSPRALPAGFRARAEAGVHESGWPIEITTDRDGSAMILVPGGQYDLGRPNGPAEEGPMHRVALTTFYIDQHEVTGGQYRIYQGGRPSQVTLSDDRSPVVNVTQAEATEYLAWVGKRLPTEAQWEAAARSWDGRLYVWGQGLPSENKPGDGRVIGPVMMTPADVSVFGAFDLGGNAWEWTKDTFTTQYHDQYKGQIAVDPQQGPDKSRARFPEATVKGGSKDWTITWRAGAKPESRLPYLGFRGVLVVEGGPPTGAGPAPASGASPPGQAQPGRPAEPAKAKGEVVPF